MAWSDAARRAALEARRRKMRGRLPGEEIDPRNNLRRPRSVLVYRLGRRPRLGNTNAGNAYGVADHLVRLDDYDKPSTTRGSGNRIFAYQVRATRPWRKYVRYQGGQDADMSGSTNPGRTIAPWKHAPSVSYSLPRGSFKAKLVKSVPLSAVRRQLARRGYRGNFDWSGSLQGGIAIRDVMGRRRR